MKALLKELLSSKKFIATVGAIITSVAIKLGAPEPITEMIPYFLGLVAVYVGAQGMADFGKAQKNK